jgi:hypothetical protein
MIERLTENDRAGFGSAFGPKIAAAVLVLLVWCPHAELSAQIPPAGLGRTYLQSLEAVLAETATVEDVERLTFLYSVDIVYEHSRVGARVQGRDAMAEAMTGMLGRTRNPDTDVHGSTQGEGVVVLDYTLEMEMRTEAGWRPIERRQITVLEVNAQGRITRILEYW